FPPAPHSLRDRPAAPLLPAPRRPADGPAPAVGCRVPLPVQGDRQLLVGGHRAGGAPRHRVDVPCPAAGEPEGRRTGLLLQREGGSLPGRGAAGAPAHALQLTGGGPLVPASGWPPVSSIRASDGPRRAEIAREADSASRI